MVEGEVAANSVMPVPTDLGEHGLTVFGFGDIDGLAAEPVVLKAPLRHALLPAVLSSGWTCSHQCGHQQQPSSEHHHSPRNNTAPHHASFYYTPVLRRHQQVIENRTSVSIGNVEAVLVGDLVE